MKRVLVLISSLTQASYRLRIAALIEPLRQRGFDLQVRVRPRDPVMRWLYFHRLERDWHAIILQRKMLNSFEAGAIRKRSPRIFYDIDDAVMYSPRRMNGIAHWRSDRALAATKRTIDHAVVGNNYLADIFRGGRCAVSLLPTVVDPQHYRVKSHVASPSPRLVWIGSRSTLPYLEMRRDAFAEAARRVPGLELLIIADETMANPPLPTQLIPWSEAGESAALCEGDIGIAPMPEDPWTLGKCGFKIVQYMAAGLPVIASPVGANRDIVMNDQTGLLADSSNDWVNAIERLAKDANLRATMGSAGRARVEREYSLDRAINFWTELLSG